MPDRSIEYPSIVLWSLAGIALLAAGIFLGWYIDNFTSWSAFFFRENGPVEGPQALVIVVASILFLWRYQRSDGPVAAWCAPVAYVLVHAILRETPRCDSHFYTSGICLTGPAKDYSVAIASLIFLGLLYLRRKDLLEMIRPRWAFVFWPLGVAVILLATGEMAEGYHSEGIEESMEFMAYFYTVAFATWIVRKT